MITLSSDSLVLTLDPDYGGDVTSLLAHGNELLYQSTWRDRAQRAIEDPATRLYSDPTSSWLERYRGGWQLLCPVAGGGGADPGAPVLFHGEASRVRWVLDSATATTASLGVDLQTATLAIRRDVEVAGATVTVVDTVTNTGRTPCLFDYAHHLALGADLLDGECLIESGASRFVRDWEYSGSPPVEIEVAWPPVGDVRVDIVPARPAAGFEFGWLTGFDRPWARVTNRSRGLSVSLEWSDALPHAWVWQELDASPGWPWFARERVLGLEPSSTPTSGPRRESSTRLAPGESITIRMSVRVEVQNAGPAGQKGTRS
ncbi:hypothetical protein BH10ACT7_BH10ACT7_00900 [soil metagenome]